MAGTATAISSTEALTSPPNSSTAWDLAVPLGPEPETSAPKRSSHESTSVYNKPGHRHRTPNGKPRSRTSSQTGSMRGSNNHDSYGREIGPMTKEATDSYNAWKGDLMSPSSVDGETRQPDDNWIHRDKLARIESEELQQAAMRIQRQVRTGSKASSMRGRSHDTHSLNGNVVAPPDQTEPWPGMQRQPLDSPIPFEDSDEPDIDNERRNWDLRRPEEIAASSIETNDDTSSAKFYKSPALKKSSSRIPVLASSPHHATSELSEREYSIQRKRTRTVGSGDESGISFTPSRRASETTVVDTPEASPESLENRTTPPISNSRPGSRGGPLSQGQSSPTKKASTSAKTATTARKSSAPPNGRKPTTTGKPRATSGSSMSKDRPITRSGDRPSTSANRPEGDPPWLATMYKPDPRLPPDQQMLPTHAKKMQQELWEKEGKTPTAYDREFAPLAVRSDESIPDVSSPEQEQTSAAPEDNTLTAEPTPSWPLQSPRSPEPVRPGTSGTNYSTMPKVQTAPPIAMPTPQRVQPALSSPPPQEDDKVEKGCGFCIVM